MPLSNQSYVPKGGCFSVDKLALAAELEPVMRL